MANKVIKLSFIKQKPLIKPSLFGNILTLYLIETPLNTFENRADPDQSKSCLIRVYSVCFQKYDTSDPTLVDLVLVYQHERLFIELSIVGGA